MLANEEALILRETNVIEEGDIIIPSSVTTKKRRRKCVACGAMFPSEECIAYKGKNYCKTCYETCGVNSPTSSEIQTISEKIQLDKKLFWEYVSLCYGIDEIPDWWVAQAEKMVKVENKKWGAMRYTLWYVKNIRGVPLSSEYGLSIIKNNYKSAAEYYAKMNKVFEYNKTVDMVAPTIRKVKVDSPQEERIKPKTRIEDL